ncbi:MAG: hypothetical protein R2737_02045 [Candidatus Nanopelagicales bacterium]
MSTRRSTRLYRVRRYDQRGQVKAVRIYSQPAAAQELARRWLAVPTTSRVTVETAAATFTPTAAYAPLPLPPEPTP